MSVEIRRGSGRFADRSPGRATWHSFSFGEHYDPDRLRFGPMVCHDEHLLGDGRGFGTHAHEELEIVTWVVSGALAHRDSLGSSATLRPGQVGHLRAGSGVTHSEIATAPQTRFVQAWLVPDAAALAPSYAVTEVAAGHGFVEVLRPTAGSALYVARLDGGESAALPAGARRHLFVASGALLRSSLAEPLGPGDAFLIEDEDDVEVTAAVPTELLAWALDRPLD